MRIFVDCEFNGFGGELISMALVPEEGPQSYNWYGVLGLPEEIDPWVAENVIPVLHAEPMGKEFFRASFLAYVRQYENPTICADWYTDLVHFFSLFAGENHTESVGYACTAELVLIDNYQSAIPHNALMDATAIRDAWPSKAKQSEAAV